MGGSDARHPSDARAQRDAKGHPAPSFSGGGISPGMGFRVPRSHSMSGMASKSPSV